MIFAGVYDIVNYLVSRSCFFILPVESLDPSNIVSGVDAGKWIWFSHFIKRPAAFRKHLFQHVALASHENVADVFMVLDGFSQAFFDRIVVVVIQLLKFFKDDNGLGPFRIST